MPAKKPKADSLENLREIKPDDFKAAPEGEQVAASQVDDEARDPSLKLTREDKPKGRHGLKVVAGKDEAFINLMGGQFRFECSCGEKGDWRSREDFAHRDADRHRAENV